MAILKCKMCGGDLEVINGTAVAECEYCGSKQTVPNADNEKKMTLFSRANRLRMGCDFDKAAGVYENIVAEFPEEAEAYWGLVLCKYGIEYVEEKGKRVPTVNRAQFTSILADVDYLTALEHADLMQKPVYQAEAKVIDEIQKGILSISENEQSFDVFICYKETDANGRRTMDSAIAAELYQELTREGFKVFFSRITLEDKLGSAYEPYIFAALNSAKVMVVIGTKKEHLESVWVKNEWSRYLTLIKNGAQKKLIPAYRDMSPYDLPDEFSHLQAQDMSKLGFMHDLVHGIKKLTAKDEPKTAEKESVVAAVSTTSTVPLLKRAYIFLEDGEWQLADEYCEKVLDIDPECGEAYLGKLMAELKIKRKELLKNLPKPFNTNKNYSKILKYSDEETVKVLKEYLEYINKRIEEERLESAYMAASESASMAESEADFLKAADMFGKIRHYGDSAEQERKCREIAELTKQEAIRKKQDSQYRSAVNVMTTAKTSEAFFSAEKTFKEISGYKDSDTLADKCKALAEEYRIKEEAENKARIEAKNKALAERKKKEEENRKAEEEKRKLRIKQLKKEAQVRKVKLIIRIVISVILGLADIGLCVLSFVCFTKTASPETANNLPFLVTIFTTVLGAYMFAVIFVKRSARKVFCIISIVLTVFWTLSIVAVSFQRVLPFDKTTVFVLSGFGLMHILNMLYFYRDWE